MTQPASVPVTHNAEASRFEVHLDGERAAVEYRRRGEVVTFTHTEVPPSMEGQGVGSALTQAALEHARRERWTVVPQCPFVAAYIEEHAEFSDLVRRP